MAELLTLSPKNKALLALADEETNIFKGQSIESIRKIVEETPMKELVVKILLKLNSM